MVWLDPQRGLEIADGLLGIVTTRGGAPREIMIECRCSGRLSQQGVVSATTDPGGRFLLPHLTPARYDVRVEHEGFRPAELHGVDVRLGQRGEVAVTLAPGAFSDTVEVTAAATILDLRSASVGLTVDDELISRVPVGRRLADTFYLAPGASSSSGAGATNPSISGASGLEN